MKDLEIAEPSYFHEEECRLEDLQALCSQEPDPDSVPHAAGIEKKIPIYEGDLVRSAATDPAKRRALMAELARVLRTGPGVLVVRRSYEDNAIIDRATDAYENILAEEAERGSGADHFAAAGANGRIWNAAQKLCLRAPEVFAAYHGNRALDLVCEAWLGPNYQVTTQVNLVRPGGKAQQAHRDYHLGFQTAAICARYPAHVHDLSPVLTLQGGVAHVDMPIEAGPTKLLPCSQAYRAGYAAWRLPDFREYFESNHVQLPLRKGDAIWFNPALFHAGGENRTEDVQRFVNLFQVSSAFGRAMETLDRRAMAKALYPVLATGTLSASDADAAIAACAEGYSFPTNLDTDPPEGGLAPETQADLFRRALREAMTSEAFADELDAMAARQSP